MRFRPIHIPVIFNKIIPSEPESSTPTVVSVSSASATEGSDIVLTVTLSGTTIAPTDYAYAITTENGLGNADIVGGAFTAATFSNSVSYPGTPTGNLTVPAGVSSFTCTWSILDDALYEYNERIALTVSGIKGTGIILDNDTAPVVSLVANQTAAEGSTMTFSVSISAAAGRAVSVNYATSDNTALAGSDYTAASGTLTWSPLDATNKTFTVAILADAVTPETGEYFTVTLSNPSACTIGTGTATGTITNVAPPTVSTVSSQSANEGTNMVFTVTLTGVTTVSTPFSYALSGTASAPSDYSATPSFSTGVTESGGTLTVPSGVSSFTITYTTVVNGDAAETIILTVGGVSGTGTIVDLGSATYGDSLSTKVLTTDILDNAATTDTINLYDGVANGNFFIVPPASGTFTKTIHKSGSANSLGFSKSRIGYARIEGHNTSSPKYRIGNADLTLNQSHCVMMLIRIDRDSTTTGVENFAGEFELLKTTQTDGSGNPLFKIAIAGSTFATATRRRLVTVQRSGILTATPGPLYECAGSSGSTTYSASVFGSGGPTGANWAWVMAVGFSASDPAWSAYTSLVTNSAASIASRAIHAGYALHGSEFLNAGSVAIRDSGASGLNITNLSYNPSSTNYVTGNDGANEGRLINVDFVIGGSNHASTSRIVDVARVIKLNTLPDANAIAMICSGMHPQNMGLMSGDDFCLDFDALPANTTLIQGTSVFNFAEDGPVCTDYFGNNASDITMSVTNRRVA